MTTRPVSQKMIEEQDQVGQPAVLLEDGAQSLVQVENEVDELGQGFHEVLGSQRVRVLPPEVQRDRLCPA